MNDTLSVLDKTMSVTMFDEPRKVTATALHSGLGTLTLILCPYTLRIQAIVIFQSFEKVWTKGNDLIGNITCKYDNQLGNMIINLEILACTWEHDHDHYKKAQG